MKNRNRYCYSILTYLILGILLLIIPTNIVFAQGANLETPTAVIRYDVNNGNFYLKVTADPNSKVYYRIDNKNVTTKCKNIYSGKEINLGKSVRYSDTIYLMAVSGNNTSSIKKYNISEMQSSLYDNEIKRIVKIATNQAENDYEKAAGIFMYFHDNFTYTDQCSDFQALFKKTGVCDELSTVYQKLCEAAGLTCEKMTYHDYEPDAHAFCRVKLNGKWNIIDPVQAIDSSNDKMFFDWQPIVKDGNTYYTINVPAQTGDFFSGVLSNFGEGGGLAGSVVHQYIDKNYKNPDKRYYVYDLNGNRYGDLYTQLFCYCNTETIVTKISPDEYRLDYNYELPELAGAEETYELIKYDATLGYFVYSVRLMDGSLYDPN
ncbi:hypothetical protein Ana3638_20860 [Anaerocolumna sedimenticola]|uniref:Transglutaminase-like domain-containing protein n=1 Tax=Anaerocolumna sedimenticola TaxID=2696063 RepID=A0A6P1TRF4_9FIRM|nr:transglutaminase domain-containing protein [Anaerocolumna sedimenticola]QHQ62927.1 hypothetical protein Ana3638_20860 [Anaerocolumna sedimenticola]